MTLENHPIANIFPMMSPDEHARLKKSISEHGLMEPIMLYEGKILDGRNRYAVCQELGVEVFHGEFFEAEMGMTAVQFVLATNRDRRHLDASQLSIVAARLKGYYDAEARERKKQGAQKKDGDNCPTPNQGRSADKAGESVGVSGKSVQRAEKVLTKGTPSVVNAVESGQMAVSKAAKVVDLPPEDQDKIVAGEMELPPQKPKAEKPYPPKALRESNNAIESFNALLREAIENEKLLPFCNDALEAMAKAVLDSGNPGYSIAFVDQLGRICDRF